MKKYIKEFFSNEMIVMILMLLSVGIYNQIDLFIMGCVWFLSSVILISSITKYYIFFRVDLLNERVNHHLKRESANPYSKTFKLYLLIIFLTPLFVNQFLVFLYFDSIYLTIIWAIVLISEIFFYIKIKKYKKKTKQNLIKINRI